VHLVQAVHAGSGFFGHALDLRQARRIPVRGCGQLLFDRIEQANFFFRSRIVQHRCILFRARAQMQQQCRIAAIVEDHVRVLGLALRIVGPLEDPMGEFPVIIQRLALEREHRGAGGGNCSGCVILGRVDIAGRPAHVGAERFQRLDQHCGLDRHVDRTGNPRAFQRLGSGEFFADRHQARHFGFGDANFLAAPIGQTQVGDDIICECGGGNCGKCTCGIGNCGVHHALLSVRKKVT
jgi:hypothetical protein